jgi:demethylspheroidene O-methyltransferase
LANKLLRSLALWFQNNWRAVLPEFLKRYRNKLLADPKFISFAQKFMFTRPVARRKSMELFDLLAGFSYSQVLYACVSLKIFEHVGQSAVILENLATKINLPVPKAELLVRAAIALELLDGTVDHIMLGQHGAALLGQPWIMRFVEHHKYFYRDLEDPVAMLRGEKVEGGLADYWSYDKSSSDKSAYSALMAASQQAVSAQILDAYDFPPHRRILDVGGGTGAFVNAVTTRHPHIEGHVFDLPGVVTLASPTIKTHGGDFRRESLPEGMDLISIVRVIHDHDDEAVLALLKNARAACTPQTILLIAEPFSGQAATARVADAYFSLYFAAMGQGRTRTPQQIADLAAKVGFGGLKQWPTNMPLITGVITLRPL